MTVLSDDVRHYLHVYENGVLVISWATSNRAIGNRIRERKATSEAVALYRSFAPRFLLSRYKSTSNVTSYEHLLHRDMLKQVFTKNAVSNGVLEYRYEIM